MTNSSDNSRKEHRALRLTAVVLVIAVAVLIVIAILCRTCSVEASAKVQVDFERIAELVELKDGVLSERRHREQKASEERAMVESASCEQGDLPGESTVHESQDDEETVCDDVQLVESLAENQTEVSTETNRNFDFVMGEQVIPADILIELKARLIAHNIEWWYPIGCAQIFQESHGNSSAVNKNGLDMGVLQYRITYWSAVCVQHGLPADTSIFDYKAQIAIYASDTARRLASGCSVEETISMHMMSDYGHYNAKYVNDVLQWTR